MGRKALYREWRPRTFDEVVEQHHVVVSLRQSVRTGRIAHAYLFSGTRGTGKTTMAQIYSRAINCLDPQDGNPCNACEICRGILDGSLLDVIEMDAASNNSVETIRRICDEVVFSPTRAKFKVYIIDEAHMLSTGAFNALLKTLEEPPSFAVFILATTEPHRIPATILSRCQRYDFRRIPLESIVTRLEEVAAGSGVPVDRDAYLTIAALADGAMRDAISLLDQCLSSSPERVTKDDVLELAGIVNDAFMGDMAEAMVDGDAGAVLRLVDRLVMDGRDVVRFASDLAGQFRNIMVCRTTEDTTSLVRLPDAALARMKALAARMDLADVLAILRGLSALITDLRWAPDPRTTFEVGLIRLMPEASLPAAPVRTPAPAAAAPAAQAATPVEPPLPPSPQEDDVPPATPAIPAATDDEAKEIWTRALWNLQESGQMGLYLFVRDGAPRLEEQNRFAIRFSPDAGGHKAELERKETLKLVRAAVAKALGHDAEVRFDFAKDGTVAAEAPVAESWVDKARKAAQTNGIPFRVEE
jgi:DNA polymerase III subunit gamma/tau